MAGDWASPLGDGSIYDLELSVRGADGAVVPLASLAGAPVVITMFYATCPAACPRLIDDLKGIERDLDPAVRAKLRFVLVSFDPARDTPAKLRELATERELGAGWVLTAAEDDAARELAAALGIKYRALDSGEFFHTSVLTVLDDTVLLESSLEFCPTLRLVGEDGLFDRAGHHPCREAEGHDQSSDDTCEHCSSPWVCGTGDRLGHRSPLLLRATG